MQGLDEKEWQAFEIQDVFTIDSGVRLESRNRTPGDRPFIGALDNSNGVVEFVGDTNTSLDSNVLGVNYNGNGMGIGFYHPYECIFSDDVKRFHWKYTEDKEELALFAKTMIEKQRGKFGYLYKFNAKRMAATSIELPVDDDKQPDFAYMQEYIQECRDLKLQQYIQYVEKRIAELGEYVEIPTLHEKEWRSIKLSTIMSANNSRAYHAENLNFQNGTLPYITRTAKDNGLYGLAILSDDMVKNPANVITFGAETAEFFYQPYQTITGNKMYYMTNEKVNKYTGLFIALCLRNCIKNCFGYANGAIPERVMRKKIMLPVDNAGEPDYAYMEQYSKNMMLRKYQQYLDYLNK